MTTAYIPTEVSLPTVPIERLAEAGFGERAPTLLAQSAEVAKALRGRVVWNLSSTAAGGGVAEMLHPLLAYSRGAGVDTRWMVIAGDERFFEITKRLHNGLHGHEGSKGDLGDAERAHVEKVSRRNHEQLHALIRPGDIVICHDPQTAWLVPLFRDDGVTVVWRCHVGTEHENEWTERAWRFLDAVDGAQVCIFSRQQYVPDHLRDRARIIAPSIDPLRPKNAELTPDQILRTLGHLGILRVLDISGPAFDRVDGSPGRIDHHADVIGAGPMPDPETPFVVQISRWDALKDMRGVMTAFADHVDGGYDANLVLAGPNVSGVADDPEGSEVLDDCISAWRDLSHEARSRITLVCLPMYDADENAVMVNALQRHADIVVQKSLEEGFGLTVSEAMWKGRAVIASRVGGIQDQIVDGENGVLVDPTDPAAFGAAVRALLGDPDRADAMGRAAKEHVREHFLGDRNLLEYGAMILDLVSGPR